MAITQDSISVGTNPTLLVPRRTKALISCTVSSVFLGNDAVIASDGWEVGPNGPNGNTFEFETGPDEELYGIASSGTVPVRVFTWDG